MAWRLAYSLETLRGELNAIFPFRDKSSDGAIGDTAHAATASDHNPNPQGVVCAYDVDTDLDGTNDSNDPQMDRLVEWWRTHPHPNLKYVIYRGRMFSSYARAPYAPFAWRPYTKDPHISHPHISVGEGPDGHSAPGTYDSRALWGVADCFAFVPAVPPLRRFKVNAVVSDPVSGETQIAELRDDGLVWLRNIRDGSGWYNTGPLPRDAGKPLSLDAGYRANGTLDVSVRTDKGVTWVIGAPAAKPFGSWYVPR